MNTNNRLIAVAKLAGFIFVLALITYWIYVFLHTGKLEVITDSSNAVTVSRLNGETITQKNGGLSIKLRNGQYTVSVHGKVLSTNQTITIGGRQVVRRVVHTKAALVIQPVIAKSVQDVRADGSTLSFLNPDDGNVYKIDQSNTLASISGSGLYRSISWLDNSTAVVQSQSGYMFKLANGQIKPLDTTLPALRGAVSTFGVAPNGSIYIAAGRQVYAGDGSGNYRAIYNAGSIVSGLYPSNDSVAVLTTKIGGTKQPETTATVTLVQKDGQFIAKDSFPLNDEFEANFSVVWSPNGQRLAIANGTSLGAIFDGSLKKITDLPSSNVTGIGWQSNTKLYYATTNLLWSYETNNKSASVIANAATGNTVSNITVDSTGAYVYFSVASDQNTSLSRIGLQGQTLSNSAYQLAAFFPTDLDTCSVDFINFTTPILLATYSGDIADCQAQLTTALNQDGLSQEGIQVQYLPQP